MTNTADSYLDFKNFRPFVLSNENETKMIWERSSKTSNSAKIIVSPLSPEGKILDSDDVEVLNEFGNGRRPSLFLFNEKFFALWFDDRNGVNNVHLSENLGVQWIEIDSILRRQDNKNNCVFPAALVFQGEKPSISLVWQQENSRTNQIALLEEDLRAEPPSFSARNFKLSARGNVTKPSVKVVMPNDISGILGFSGICTFDKNEEPKKDILNEQFRKPSDNIISGKVDLSKTEDEILYFKACVLDRAGNWSPVATVEYYFDQTPPKKLLKKINGALLLQMMLHLLGRMLLMTTMKFQDILGL